ncbi:hypothetical protein MN0502_07340 [Arthrobacter sp. MN05-02]|nr:hypothetical protein MN0502_07340 [Arthrobacter sp. MN05-02]
MELSSSRTLPEVLVSNVIPRLSPFGRSIIIERVSAGRPVAHVAKELGVSRQTAYRWVRRYRAEGIDGLQDRSSRPRTFPTRTSRETEQAVLAARTQLRAGPLRIAAATGVPARTVSRILRQEPKSSGHPSSSRRSSSNARL